LILLKGIGYVLSACEEYQVTYNLNFYSFVRAVEVPGNIPESQGLVQNDQTVFGLPASHDRQKAHLALLGHRLLQTTQGALAVYCLDRCGSHIFEWFHD
jgi:hypothetical protein